MDCVSSTITISSELANIKNVFKWLEDDLFKLIKKKEKIANISLVVQEALVNAIVHGNNKDKNKKVALSYKLKNRSLVLEIEDEGEGIPRKKQEKHSSNIQNSEILESSGRGIILIKHFCKEVKFNKNRLSLFFGDIDE